VYNLLDNISRLDDIEKKFDLLIDSIENCRLCPNMEARTKVFSEFNGNINSNVLFIAEAPGRLGADRTAIPLFGDQTGNNFQYLIDTIEWSREQFFITNAVLCNPRDEKGNNAPPNKKHIKNCSAYLDILIRIMNPDYVITLGQKALDAVHIIDPIKISLKENVRSIVNWNNRSLIPLYHTGPRALVHRSLYNQLADFYWLSQKIKINAKPWKRIEKVGLSAKMTFEKLSLSKIQKVIMYVLDKTGPITEFQLTKLLYLIDYSFLNMSGKILTNSFYLRAYEGPLPMGLNKQLKTLERNGYTRNNYGKIESIYKYKNGFQDEEIKIIDETLRKYGHKSSQEIKTITYLTKPMKRILRTEKQGVSMLWKPVFTDEDFE
jgi:uracil-DNA glycosylase family 4